MVLAGISHRLLVTIPDDLHVCVALGRAATSPPFQAYERPSESAPTWIASRKTSYQSQTRRTSRMSVIRRKSSRSDRPACPSSVWKRRIRFRDRSPDQPESAPALWRTKNCENGWPLASCGRGLVQTLGNGESRQFAVSAVFSRA
jgi:hypothetical protein